jgi:hypothetical protein
MAAIDRLIEDLRAEGSVDSEGRFTLDREQARAKMQKFQLVDARRYVLELVQAAVLRDATYVVFEIDADDMHMRFDGTPFAAAEIDDLYGSLFADGDTRPLRGVRQLALALNAALGMTPKHIHVRSGTVELRMRPGQPDEITTHEQASLRTEIHVRQRLRARVLVDYFRNLTGRMAEEQYLRARCMYSSVPVTLEGKTLSFGLEGGEPGLASLSIAGRDFRGVMKVVDRSGPCELRLVKDGVWIDTRELPDCGTNLIAVVEGEHLRKDVSQAKIVANAALERIEASLRRLRWQLWRNAAAQQHPEQPRIRAMIHTQLLVHSTLQELKEIPEAIELSTQITWSDCRNPKRLISLRELVEREGAVSYAEQPFPEVPCEGEPILLIDNRFALAQLERTLGRGLVHADKLLDRERRRALGHKAWLAREGKPELPSHIEYLLRVPISFELGAGSVRGEIGLDADFLRHPGAKAPAHLFMFKQGRLLGRTELELGFINLWLALDGPFEPTDDYTDARRDHGFVEILLRAVAALREPLALLLAREQGVANEASYRGLLKRWLLVLVDPKTQTGLLTDEGDDATPRPLLTIEQLLPALLKATDGFATTPLFEQLAGSRLSLAQLATLVDSQRTLRYVETRPEDVRLVAPNVLITGPGDRKTLRALFGEQRLERWDPGPKLRELEFSASSRSELAAAREDAKAQLDKTGIAFEDWLLDLPPNGPTRGFVAFFMPGELSESELDSFTVNVRHQGRSLCSISLDADFGPLLAVIEHPGLQPATTWNDVVRNAAFEQVVATVDTASRELFRRGCAGLERVPATPRRKLARVLLHGAARDPELRGAAEHAPLLSLVNGRTLSLAQASELVAKRRKLEFVGRDAGFAPILDPPIIVAEGSELDELRQLLGDVLVDASDRVRHHRVYDLLEQRPAMTEAKLDPATTLVRLTINNNGQVGELGISRVRAEPGITLRLGVAGREADVISNTDGFAMPIEAVVIDEELPLDSRGKVDVGSKRMKTLLRQCRRRVPELVLALCKSWHELGNDARALAWPLLLRHLTSEAKQERRQIREQAFAAATAVAGFRDVRGRRVSLAELLGRKGPIDVLVGEQFRGLKLDLPALERPILVVDAEEHACLHAQDREVRELDAGWEDTLATLRALTRAPKVETPNVHEVAIAYRKAMVAGGLECELWIPRAVSLLDSMPELIFTRAGREVGRGRVCESLPSEGLIRGDALVVSGGELELDERQYASLERQLVIMYTELANRFADDGVSKADHARALEYLSWAAAKLDSNPLSAHGKHAIALTYALDRVVPSSVRRLVQGVKPKPKPVEREPEPKLEPAPTPTPAAMPSAPEAPKQWPTTPTTPEQRLLAAVYEQLHWARSRHPLVELLLNNLQLRAGMPATELARSERRVLALNPTHPIVARLLGQDPHDPIDLAFLLAALYSYLNYEAEEISDDDERLFVARLAETLAVSASLQAAPGQAAQRGP